MKNLDIEKLERKNIYKTPPDFFETVQANVMREAGRTVSPVTERRTIQSRYTMWYAAAAAIVLIFGGTFLYNLNTDKDDTFAQHTENQNVAKARADQQPEGNTTTVPASTENYITLVNDLTLAETENQKERLPVAAKPVSPANKRLAAAPKAELQMEMILDDFSAEDLAALSQNSEQDVYLDLYN
jgi:hypothetical protein